MTYRTWQLETSQEIVSPSQTRKCWTTGLFKSRTSGKRAGKISQQTFPRQKPSFPKQLKVQHNRPQWIRLRFITPIKFIFFSLSPKSSSQVEVARYVSLSRGFQEQWLTFILWNYSRCSNALWILSFLFIKSYFVSIFSHRWHERFVSDVQTISQMFIYQGQVRGMGKDGGRQKPGATSLQP